MRPRALVLLVLLAAPGCMRWSTPAMPAPGVRSTEPVARARLTLDPAGTLLLRDVVVQGDSVIGHRETGERVALHRSRVRGIEARKVSAWRTAGAVVGGLAVTYVVLLAYLLSTMDW